MSYTLHSPEEQQAAQFSLHTPVDPPRSHSPHHSPSQHHGNEHPAQSLGFVQQPTAFPSPASFPSPPSHSASQYSADQYHVQPMPSQGFSHTPQTPTSPHLASGPYAAHIPSPHSSPPSSPGLPPLPGVDTYMMTTPQPSRSPPPTFEQYQAQHHPPPSQSMSPPPAFDPHDPNPPAPSEPSGQRRPPMPPVPIDTTAYNSDISPGPQTPKTPVYTPGAAAGPNGGVHAPGQIGHPNQKHGLEEYHHGLCDCFSDISTCCMGCWCPCILYSRTYHRLKTVPNSNLNEFSACNTHCTMFCLLAPVSFIFTTLQRTRIRENYRLKGSVFNDCCKAYCCVMCTLTQDDREVNHREDERRRFAGPGSGVVGDGGYRRQPTMTYP